MLDPLAVPGSGLDGDMMVFSGFRRLMGSLVGSSQTGRLYAEEERKIGDRGAEARWGEPFKELQRDVSGDHVGECAS
eukprot:1711651-Rhodomonas_salina.3